MGNIPDNKNNVGNASRKPSCLMAYSLNNHQPVECTIISDQPFFYMDDVTDFEDDAILAEDAALYESLECEIADLKDKINSYDRLSLDFAQPRDKALQDFIVQGTEFEKTDSTIQTIRNEDELKAVLQTSRYASALLDHAYSKNISLKVSETIERSILDMDAKTISIQSNLTLPRAVFGLVRELRRFWQMTNGTGIHPLAFHPDHAVLVNRAQIADYQTAIIRTAWELKLAGDNAYWDVIENSSHFDLGRAFAREALADFRTINNGKASSAVFETWFLSDRCAQEDKQLIQMMLGDYDGYMIDHSSASKMISIELITKLGEQPFGNNYLAPYAQMILNDPIFTDVRDRANANFLWFIKFERSFNEAEQELQTSEVDQARDVHHAFFNKDNNCENAEHQKEDTHHGNNVISINFARHQSDRNEQQS